MLFVGLLLLFWGCRNKSAGLKTNTSIGIYRCRQVKPVPLDMLPKVLFVAVTTRFSTDCLPFKLSRQVLGNEMKKSRFSYDL